MTTRTELLKVVLALALALAASLLVLVGPLTNKAQAQTSPPAPVIDLVGEQFNITKPEDLKVTGPCTDFQDFPNSNLTFEASGVATGPYYTGTFTETGTIKLGPPSATNVRPVLDVKAHFTIDSTSHLGFHYTIEGDKEWFSGSEVVGGITVPGSTGTGTCQELSSGLLRTGTFNAISNLRSTATIVPDDGRVCTAKNLASLSFGKNFSTTADRFSETFRPFAALSTPTCVVDSSPPKISIADTTVNEVDTGTSDATFTVTLSKTSTNEVRVDYATADGTATQPDDYQQKQDTLTFGANERTTTVTVPVRGDTADEDDESFSVLLSNPQNAEIADGEGTATIVDDEAPYAVKDLGALAGASFSMADSINDLGEVVGQKHTSDDAREHGFLYSGDQVQDLGPLSNQQDIQRLDINDSGQIVGESDAHTSSGESHAFLYEDGQMTDLGVLGGDPGFRRSGARGINDSGEVVGFSTTAGNGGHAFLYKDGQMTDLGVLGGDPGGSQALDVNNSGQVVGFSDTDSGDTHPFLYKDGQMTDLGTLPGAPGWGGFAWGINASGQVVGETSNSSGNIRAFLYSGGEMRDLGTLAGDEYTFANDSSAHDINDSGQIVGESATPSSPVPHHAFLYKDGQMQDLNDLIPTDSGLDLQSAWGINTDG
jgi:probable HAF family extracellular repeat protein